MTDFRHRIFLPVYSGGTVHDLRVIPYYLQKGLPHAALHPYIYELLREYITKPQAVTTVLEQP